MDIKKIGLFSPSFLLQSILVLSPAISQMCLAFPNISVSTVQSVLTLPYLVAIPVMLLSYKIAAKYTKKEIVEFAIVLLMIGGLLPIFFHNNFYLILLCSGIYGVGLGLYSPLATSLLNENFPPEVLPKMLGIQSTIVACGSVFYSFIGGILADIKWWYVYFVYFILIIVLVLFHQVPNDKPEEVQVSYISVFEKKKTIFYLLQGIFVSCCFYVISANISLFVTQNNLGTSKTAGLSMSLYSVIGMIAGLYGGKIIAKTKKYSFAFLEVVHIVGMIIILLSLKNEILVFVGMALMGVASYLRMPAGYNQIANSVKPEYRNASITVYCSSSYLGQFLSTMLLSILVTSDSAFNKILVGLVMLIAVFVATIIVENKKGK